MECEINKMKLKIIYQGMGLDFIKLRWIWNFLIDINENYGAHYFIEGMWNSHYLIHELKLMQFFVDLFLYLYFIHPCFFLFSFFIYFLRFSLFVTFIFIFFSILVCALAMWIVNGEYKKNTVVCEESIALESAYLVCTLV